MAPFFLRPWFVLLLGGLPLFALAAERGGPVNADAAPRTRESFNRDWRFLIGDHAGAQATAFDDSAWSRVGLPHSFSIPYFLSADFYTGYGWYRRTFQTDAASAGQRVFIEFEGAFQETEVFVNGHKVGTHRGGYTGFSFDITAALRPGENLLAVRVNNLWKPDLAPRAGEHVFSGGIYRDVWLVKTGAVHVPWCGVGVTTPEVSDTLATVRVSTELRNDSSTAVACRVVTDILSPEGTSVARVEATEKLAAGALGTVIQSSAPIESPKLWHPAHPNIYRAITRVYVGEKLLDRVETSFGIRRFEWTADRGFFINGKHHYFLGANAHQDLAGWGDAITNGAIARDIRQIKAAGFDFIRGSHYPHDPAYSEICDSEGVLLLQELCLWGTASFKNPWGSSAYPSDPKEQDAFDAQIHQTLREMIRIHRNHPSVVGWSMGNEIFFTDPATMPRLRKLVSSLVALARELDPHRAAVVSGAQRGEIDKLGDVAGYNGDGARLFINPGVPNFVAEYGSTIADRPGEYAPGWGDLPDPANQDSSKPYPWRYPWRSGEVIWCAFDHGSIAGHFGCMGMVDYFRLPKRQWYWYRNAYRGVPPPAWPQAGQPAALRLEADRTVIHSTDGTDDAHIVVTVLDAKGTPINNCPPVTLTVESGPGEFPTGPSITFAPDSDIAIRDGQAAIALRSYHGGRTTVVATSPGLAPAKLELEFVGAPAFVAGVTPPVQPRPYKRFDRQADVLDSGLTLFGRQTPTRVSGEVEGRLGRFANDGDPATRWSPPKGDQPTWWQVDLERLVAIHAVKLTFPETGDNRFKIEVSLDATNWRVADDYTHVPGSGRTGVSTPEKPVTGRFVRITFPVRNWGPAPGLSEVEVLGHPDTR